MEFLIFPSELLSFSSDFFFTEQFLLMTPKDYNFISNGAMSLANMDDRAEFKATLEAMRDMGMSQDELDPIFKVNQLSPYASRFNSYWLAKLNSRKGAGVELTSKQVCE